MNLRRERTPQVGASNLVFHPDSFTTPRDFKQKGDGISFATISKGKKATDIIEKKVTKGLISPLTKTEDFYKTTGKLVHSKTAIGYPRLAQLEEKEKRKLVFTGESFLIYDKKLEKYRDNDLDVEYTAEQLPNKDNLVKEKHNIHGNAVHETQLVGYDKHSADTLKNNVNLEKIREARRVLRRRYASRKNLYSIYNAWDEDHTGTVTIENVYTMSKKLGLNLNVDEARVLLASANKSGTGELTLDEFLDLIYNKDDVLNIDLDHLAENLGKDYLVRREELEKEDDNLIKKLEEDAKHTREIKHMNQTNLILKNRLHDISSNFYEADPFHVGYVNYEKFEAVLKKLAISESVVSEQDIKNLFNKHRSDNHTIDYKNFIEMLKQFHFQYEDMYKEQKVPKRTNSVGNVSLVDKEEEEFHIVDCRKLPCHGVMDYWTRTKKVSRAIKRFFPNKEDFYSYLGNTLHLDNEKILEKYVNRKELKSIVDGLFSNFDDSNVVKKDFGGFLSSCIYNTHGDTNLKEVAKLIYEEEENEFYNKINLKKKGPGPRRELAENTTEDEEASNNKTTSQGPRALNELPTIANTARAKDDEGVDKLLQKIDDNFFVGSKRAYDAFKAFDADKDGYISRKDFAKKLNDMAIMSKEEGRKVLEYLDPENKGFVNFQEFSKKIRPNMAKQDEKADFKVLPFVNPSKEAVLRTTKMVPQTSEQIKRTVASFQPDDYEQKPKTRYNANPSWKNTFLTFQAGVKSPMFMSEAERFDRDPQARVRFQHESNQRQKEFDSTRIKNKQKFTAFFNERIEQETTALDRLDENRRAKKYLQQVRYEQRAKLFNSYV